MSSSKPTKTCSRSISNVEVLNALPDRDDDARNVCPKDHRVLRNGKVVIMDLPLDGIECGRLDAGEYFTLLWPGSTTHAPFADVSQRAFCVVEMLAVDIEFEMEIRSGVVCWMDSLLGSNEMRIKSIQV